MFYDACRACISVKMAAGLGGIGEPLGLATTHLGTNLQLGGIERA